MKTIIMLLALAVPVVACGPNCEEHSGVCACTETPEVGPSVQPSSEKPPRNQIPSWQSGEVVPDTRASLIYVDAEQDRKLKEADAIGKAAAGIK